MHELQRRKEKTKSGKQEEEIFFFSLLPWSDDEQSTRESAAARRRALAAGRRRSPSPSINPGRHAAAAAGAAAAAAKLGEEEEEAGGGGRARLGIAIGEGRQVPRINLFACDFGGVDPEVSRRRGARVPCAWGRRWQGNRRGALCKKTAAATSCASQDSIVSAPIPACLPLPPRLSDPTNKNPRGWAG